MLKMVLTHIKMGFSFGKKGFLHYLYNVIKKNKIMKIVVLVKHIMEKTILTMYFKNEDQALEWWYHFPCSEEWEIIHKGKRESSGHRYELKYSKFDEQGNMHAKYIICFSKKEALALKKKINTESPNYITSIKKLY